MLADGSIAVADVAASRILLFDGAGRLMRSLGRRGDGPGEMRRLGSLTVISGDTLVTFDPGLRRLSYWHPQGGFARSVNLADGGSLDSWPSEAYAWRDTMIVVLQLSTTPLDSIPPGNGIRKWPVRAHLTLRDRTGALVASSPSFDGMYSGVDGRGDIRLPFSSRPFVAAARDRLWFGSGASFTLASLDSSFAPRAELRWRSLDEPLKPDEVDSVRNEARALLAERLPPGRVAQAFANAFAPEILPRSRPSIGRVLVDPLDRIWVERFEPTRLGTSLQTPGDRWTILTRDGAAVASLRLPRLARLEDVRGDQAVVVLRDSLDVQTVAVFSVGRSRP